MAGGGSPSIPSSDRKTIELIREITRKQHSDDEIYAVLKECSMDPNETAQKLMFLDTFHEVRRKRDKRKESVHSRPQDSGPVAVAQRRGARSRRGNYSSFHVPAGGRDFSGRRNVSDRRENGISESKERGSVPSLPLLPGRKEKVSTVLLNEDGSLPNGNASQAHVAVNLSEKGGSDSSLRAVAVKSPSSSAPISTFSSVIKTVPGKSGTKSDYRQAPTSPASASGLDSASDPVLVPSSKPLQPSAVGTIKREVGTQHVSCEGNSEIKSIKAGSVSENLVQHKKSQKNEATEFNHTSKESQSLDSVITAMDSANIDDGHSSQKPSVPSKVLAADASSQDSFESNVPNGHHVTFPNNFQVPEALKNSLTFGSFKVNFGAGIVDVDDSHCGSSKSADPELPQENKKTPEDTFSRPSSSSDNLGREDPDQSLSSSQSSPEEVSPSEDNVSSGVTQENHQSKQEDLVPSEGLQGLQHPAINGAPNDAFGSVPSLMVNQMVQLDNTKNQPHDISAMLNYMGGNPSLQATTTPPLSQPGAMQSSMSMSPQPLLPLFRQPYPPNYFPYSHYIPMVMPHMQQFLSPNGIPQQASTANLYLPSQLPAGGIKYPVPQFKPGANVAHPAPFGIPSAYGSYSPSPVGYSIGPTVTIGSSAGMEDIVASQLKENHGYRTAQLNDVPAAWIPPAGQDMAGLAVNSSYNMLPQSQHVTYTPSQAVHGPYAGILQPAQTIAAPSVHTLLQQSQAMVGAIESARPQSGIYQQPQHPQMWTSNF